MFGHFTELPPAGIWPVAPELPVLPVLPDVDWLVDGWDVEPELVVAAWAAIPPPNTSAPDTATAAVTL